MALFGHLFQPFETFTPFTNFDLSPLEERWRRLAQQQARYERDLARRLRRTGNGLRSVPRSRDWIEFPVDFWTDFDDPFWSLDFDELARPSERRRIEVGEKSTVEGKTETKGEVPKVETAAPSSVSSVHPSPKTSSSAIARPSLALSRESPRLGAMSTRSTDAGVSHTVYFPGLSKDDVKLDFDQRNKALLITGEKSEVDNEEDETSSRKYSHQVSISRKIPVAWNTKPSDIHASFENEALIVSVDQETEKRDSEQEKLTSIPLSSTNSEPQVKSNITPSDSSSKTSPETEASTVAKEE